MWQQYSNSAKIDFSSLSIHETISKFQVFQKTFQSTKVMKNSWQALNRNWQTGKFKTTIHSLEFDDWNGYFDADDFLISAGHCGYFHLDDDYILKEKKVGPMLLKVLDRRTMKIQRVGPWNEKYFTIGLWVCYRQEFADISSFDTEMTCVAMQDNIVMCGCYGYIKVYDANSGQEVSSRD